MAERIYDKNEKFLAAKGIILKSTGLMFTPFDFENDQYYISLGEYSNLGITNKKTGKKGYFDMSMDILTETDFEGW